MKIAVVGAGIAGVSLSWYLTQYPEIEVTLFDPQEIAGGASGISTGLMHPFIGRRALRSWMAEEGMKETLELVAVAESELKSQLALRSGIFRPAICAHQREDFKVRAKEDQEAVWCEKKPFGEGLWIEKGVLLFSRLFLKGLWSAATKGRAKFVREKISDLSELKNYDHVVLATGAQTLQFSECKNLPVQVIKGQVLHCRWKEPLEFPLVSLGHITPTEDRSFCQIGSTYEHNFTNLAPDREVALKLIDKAAQFYPKAKSFEIVEIRSGARVTRKGSYKPIVSKIAPNAHLFTALGSRGSLYSPLVAKALASKIVVNRSVPFLETLKLPYI